MKIDIIDLTDPCYSALSPPQLALVRAAQEKKDKFVAEMEAKKQKFVSKLVDNHFSHSLVYTLQRRVFDDELQNGVDLIRENLLYDLAYKTSGSEGNELGPFSYPDNPNYNLTDSQRFIVVRQYYMDLTSDPKARLAAYAGDSLARAYLGQYYQTLYDMLYSYCK